jgi:hypothetical protein
MGGVRMAERMDSNAHFGEPGPVFCRAEGPLDTVERLMGAVAVRLCW